MTKKPNLNNLFGAKKSKTFLGLSKCENLNKIDASSAFIGAPCSTPYKTVGAYAKNGPSSIREASSSLSANLDRYNFDLGGTLFPKGTKKAVDCGDIKWSEINFKENRKRIKKTILKILKNKTVPILVGGDDSTPIPMIEAMGEIGKKYTILQIDAHIDWRDVHMGERYGLSSTMRRASEMKHIKKIIQVGARGIGSAYYEDYKDAIEWGVKFFTANDIFFYGINSALRKIEKNSKVILCVDIDAMDPSITPNTIGRSPGGLNYLQVLNLIKGVSKKGKIVAVDFVEIMPEADIDNIGSLTVSRLIAATMGIISRQ